MELSFTLIVKSGLAEELKSSVVDMLILWCLLDLQDAVNFKEEVWTGCINVRSVSTYMVPKAMSLDEMTNGVSYT